MNEMNNQAAQTMPERALAAWTGKHRTDAENRAFLAGYETCQSDANAAALSQTAGVAEGWMRDVADAAAALDKRGDRQMAARLMRLHRDMLAAAPAASGGEDIADAVDDPNGTCPTCHQYLRTDAGVPCKEHPDAPHGFDRTASHSIGRYVCECEGWSPTFPQPPSAASQSSNPNPVTPGLSSESGASVSDPIAALRDKWATRSGSLTYDLAAVELDTALEQALTQQRGELPSAETFASAVWRDWMTNQQADKLGAELRSWVAAHYATTPQPGAEDLRELQSACEPFIRHNSSEQFIDLRVPTSAVKRLRGLLESLLARGG